MRGASNRAHQRLTAELGSGMATATLALAIGHACYPTAIYGDNGDHDEIVELLKQFVPRPRGAQTACQAVEAWLDKGTLSFSRAFVNAWGMQPQEFLEKFFESSQSESGD